MLLGFTPNNNGSGCHIVLKSVEHQPVNLALRNASYKNKSGSEMVRYGAHSPDNGRTWTTWLPKPDFDSKLPSGYRRGKYPLFVDTDNGKILCIVNAMDTPGLDPKIKEPPISATSMYLRYRVSIDGGKTFLFDEPIMQEGKTPENPFDGVYRGKTGFYIGDGSGDRPIHTSRGNIIVPAQMFRQDLNGQIFNPGGGGTWTEAIMLIGHWNVDNRITWKISEPIAGDPMRTTRGMIEPTLAELPDGRIICVMRGSNGGRKDPKFKLPSYRWIAVSTDGGFHWTKPKPMTYDDGTPFFSPSSVSHILKHSSGLYFWIGNLNNENCRGNDPRYPLVIGEINSTTLCLIRDSVIAIDTKRSDEDGVNLSHFWCLEDRETKDIVIIGKRYRVGYFDMANSPGVIYRIAIVGESAPR